MTVTLPDRVPSTSVDESGAQYAWDSTSIKAAMKCPRYYAYTILWGLRPKAVSVHLEFGKHYATALEHFYKHRAEGDDIDTALRKVVREALEATWTYDEYEEVSEDEGVSGLASTRSSLRPVGPGRPVTWPDNAKTRFSLIRSIVWYICHFGDESESAIKTHTLRSGAPAVEVSFRFEMTDEILLSGHLDRIVSFNDDLWVMDQKTTGQTISGYWFDQFKPDTQFSLYALAGKIVLETPVRGVIVDGAQIAVGFTRFERGFSMRTEDEIADWWHGTEHTIAVMQHLSRGAVAPDDFPMNTESCGNYGGCAFRKVCASAPRIRPNLLKTDFRQRVWDPLVAR